MKDHEFAHTYAAVCAYLGLGLSAFFLILGVAASGVEANTLLMKSSAGGQSAAVASTVSGCTLLNGATATDLNSLLNSGCTTVTTDINAHVTIAGATTTVPAAVTLVFNTGSAWTIATGTAVIVQGAYQVPLQRVQFFYGGGQITSVDSYDSLGCPLVQRVAYPEWFGAQVNDGNDDSIAILQALGFGNKVTLAAGTYDVRNRLPFLGHQSMSGQGVSITRIDQMPNFNLINYSNDPASPYYQTWQDVKLQDFIVSLTSDCASVSNLSILGNRVTDLGPLSNIRALTGVDPVISGIQLSSHYGWRLGVPPVNNISVKNVEVYRVFNNCITLQSDRGAQNVTITGLTCTARDGGNTSGMTIEAFDPTYANHYSNVTVASSTFTGGSWGLYIAGVTNLLVDHTSVSVNSGARMAMLYYTSDNGFQTTGSITNSSFTFASPDATANSVIQIAARGYVKDTAGSFPYLQDVGSALSMNNDTITSAQYGSSATLVPLIYDNIGLDQPLKITNSSLIGGSWGILAANPADPNAFGGTVFIQQGPGMDSLVRDITPAEQSIYHVAHSDLDIENSQFTNQALSAVNVTRDMVTMRGDTFNNIGLSPQASNDPIISIGNPSPFATSSISQDSVTNNTYSSVYPGTFVSAPRVAGQLLFSGNTAFALNAASKSPSSIQGLSLYGVPPLYACPSNMVTGSACSVSHLLGVTSQGYVATATSWIKPGLTYAINFGDGTEVQVPDCTTPLSGQPTSCTAQGTISHTYTSIGTYTVSVIDYSCTASVASSTGCSENIDSASVTIGPPTAAVTTACPSNLLSQGVCSLGHLLSLTAASSLTATFASWIHPGLSYAINFGDGTEVQVPDCTTPLSGQPTSCTAAGTISHTYAQAGTYNVSVLNYACAGSTTCSVGVDTVSVTVAAPLVPPVTSAINAACPSNYLTGGVCSLSHVIGVHTVSGLSATFFSFVRPGLTYAINFGDGTEVQVPTCALPISGQPTSCTDAGYLSHTFATAGTYKVQILNYACIGSSSCSVLVDSVSVTVN